MRPDGAGGDPFPILTVGYGAERSLEELLTLLMEYEVGYLIDVRSKPYSKLRPEFCREALQAVAGAAELRYVFMGDTLGGMPGDPTCYIDGKVDYTAIRQRDWFQRGLDRLERGWRDGHRLALLCAELAPHRCHRSKLIGEALTERGVLVGHIDEDGAVITQQAVMDYLTRGQQPLFDTHISSNRSDAADERLAS